MENRTDYIEDLKVIKKIMEESSRFLSLSGLSGISAGITALVGAAVAVFGFLNGNLIITEENFTTLSPSGIFSLKVKIISDALVVLVLAVGLSAWFSYRNSVRKGVRFWTPVSRRLLVNLLIPLIAGGIFVIILFLQFQWQLIIPAMLIFYGLALVSAGKFTYGEVFYLGIIEIITGVAASVWPSGGLIFWAFGFGLLHIIYGLVMFRKYER